MFWQRLSQQRQQQQQQQQQQQKEQPTKNRVNFNFNVRIAINVNTKMTKTNVMQCQQQQQQQHQHAATTSTPAAAATTTTTATTSLSLLPTERTITKLRARLANCCNRFTTTTTTAGGGGTLFNYNGSISFMIIINLLLLLLISCDVCKSQMNNSNNNNNSNNTKFASDILLTTTTITNNNNNFTKNFINPFQIQQHYAPPSSPLSKSASQIEGVHSTLELVTRNCVQRCVIEEDLFLDNYGIKCEKGDNSAKCYKTRCTKGCSQWYRALQEFEPCQEACSSTAFFPYDLPCIAACEMAQRHYWHLQRLAMETLVRTTKPEIINQHDEDYFSPNAHDDADAGDGDGDDVATRRHAGIVGGKVVAIKWSIEFPDNYLASRPFNIQYQYVLDKQPADEHGHSMEASDEDNATALNADDNDTWLNLADYDCDEHFVCEILEGLMPYTRYRFRFELPFGESADDVLYSPPTLVYQTAAEGAPISLASITRAQALDESHIAIFWQAGRFINGPLQQYRVILSQAEHNISMTRNLSATQRSCIFAELMPATNYTLSVSMLNGYGEGPAAIVHVLTKSIELRQMSDVLEQLDGMLIAGEYSIKLKSLEPLVDTRVIYQSEQLISDFAYAHGQQRLFVINDAGELYSLSTQQESELANDLVELHLNQTGMHFRPAKIGLDWLTQRLYIAGETAAQTWTIVSTNFTGGSMNYLKTELHDHKIEQLLVEPLNGWLFWTHAQGGLSRLNLATGAQETLDAETDFGHISYDAQRWLLYAYNRSDNALYELSYDGLYKRRLLHGADVLPGEWQSFVHYTSARTLLVSNGTQVARYNYATYDLMSWPINDLEWCWHIVPLERGSHGGALARQPLALLPAQPQKLQALLSATMAKIEWQAAPLNAAYQTTVAWQHGMAWEYELEIMDVASNSAYNIRNIKTTFFKVEKLQANNLYRLRVRASNRMGVTSDWTAPLLTRTWPLGVHRLQWLTLAGDVYETNEIGAEARHLGTLAGAQPSGLVPLNGTIYYVSDGQLRCVNIMNPELNCTFNDAAAIATATTTASTASSGVNSIDSGLTAGRLGRMSVSSLAYDWRGGQLYWTDLLRDCVIRASLSANQWELLPIFGARSLAIDASHGHLYFTTQTSLARRTLNGYPASEQHEYYHVNGFAGSIRAFTLDLAQQQIFWIVRQHEGTVRLFRAALAAGKQEKLLDTALPQDCMPRTLRYLDKVDALIWLTNGGRSAAIARTTTPQQAAHITLALSASNATTATTTTMATTTITGATTLLSAVQLKPDFTPYADHGVVPHAVAIESIRIDDGYWDDFNIKWQPITTAENFSVHYNVLLEYDGRVQTMTVSAPFVRITDLQQAQLSVNISVTPHTVWRMGRTTRALLNTPAAAPTQPKRLRVFVERQVVQPLQPANISALIRWDTPEHVGQHTAVAYRVYCWHDDELFAERVHNYTDQQPLEVRVSGLTADESYTFQVQAFVAGRLSGGEKTSYHAVHISPEVQSVPRVVYATAEYIGELDLDTNARRPLVYTTSVVEHLVMLPGEQRLIWVNENVELMTYVPGAAPVKLARMRAEVLALSVDWIARNIYWAEMDTEQTQSVAIYRLELCQFEGRVMQGQKLWTTAQGQLLRDLYVQPYAQSLLWLEYKLGERNATLVGRNLTDGSVLSYKTTALWRLFEGSYEPEAETLNLIDHKGKLCAYDVQRQLCTTLKTHFNVLTDDIIDLARDAGYLYALKNNSIRAYNRRKQQLEYLIDIAEVRMLRAYNYQLYPPRQCLVLQSGNAIAHELATPVEADDALLIKVIVTGENFVQLLLPTLHADAICYLPLPGLKYNLNITDVARNESRSLSTTQRSINITQLLPFTNYEIQLIATNYYQQKLALPVYEARTLQLRTAASAPSLPQNVSALALSPTEIEVSWQPPLVQHSDSIWYVLYWQLNATNDNNNNNNKDRDDKETKELFMKELDEVTLSYTLTGLMADAGYDIWLRAYATKAKFNESPAMQVFTYEALPALQLLNASAYNLTLSWPVDCENLTSLILICHALYGESENEFSLDISENRTHILITDLEPKTKYEFYMQLTYADVERPYHWPAMVSDRFVFETLGDCPGSPGKPEIEHIAGEIFRVFWEPARDNGAPILEYSLEALQARNIRRRRRREAHLNLLPWAEEPQAIEDQWVAFCNTTDLSCIVRELHTMRFLMFRVRARNEPYGWGAYSEESERIAEPFVSSDKRDSLVLAIIAPAAIVSSCVLALVIVRKIQTRRMRGKILIEKSRPSIWGNSSTLQQQQLIAARNRAFSMTSHSTLYTGGPLSDADIALLPQIQWNQLTLQQFLGSGAFGEVYEGLLKHEDEIEPEKVAIKCLRKGASEFAELLQEAQLMSNFKHDNIVRLIGVCFDTESISLIMEHMEGGDLLSYLRESRPNSTQAQPSLQLLDLLSMCIDVATGCSYLEDMHFVHRDLACRNCLVSSRIASKRVVKIGDFGLARDIYKSDYYRKEGEGLLPVRWMSPESLVDGVFTTQSDVWAFGVLCWEILTLGQQPYAARNNFEVLAYVKEDGRLEQPDVCPDKLYTLMLSCWHTEPDERPTFRRCVTTLIAIKTDVRRLIWGGGCDDDYVSYVNSQNAALAASSSAAAAAAAATARARRPLPKVDEETATTSEQAEVQINVDAVDEKTMTKVRFENGGFKSKKNIDAATTTTTTAATVTTPPATTTTTTSSSSPSSSQTATNAKNTVNNLPLAVVQHERPIKTAGESNGYGSTTDNDDFKIYANEGVSRL